jgi:hypothetical protein
MDRVSIIAFTDSHLDRMPPTRGKGKVFNILDFLDRLDGIGETNLGQSFRNFIHTTKRRGLIVLISDLFDPRGFVDGLNVLTFQKHDLFVIHIIDEKERNPELLGDLHLVDVETDRVRPVTINESRLRRYKILFQQFCDELDQYCIHREIGMIRATTQLPFDELVLRIFRMGGFVAK